MTMARNIEKIAAGLGAKVVAQVPIPAEVRSVPPGSAISSPPSRPGSSPARAFAPAVPPTRAGRDIPRCR